MTDPFTPQAGDSDLTALARLQMQSAVSEIELRAQIQALLDVIAGVAALRAGAAPSSAAIRQAFEASRRAHLHDQLRQIEDASPELAAHIQRRMDQLLGDQHPGGS